MTYKRQRKLEDEKLIRLSLKVVAKADAYLKLF